MNNNQVLLLIEESSAVILSAKSFTERLDIIYDVLDKAFPSSDFSSALYGPITSMADYMVRAEIEPLLYALKESSRTGKEYMLSNSELSVVLDEIYKIAKQNE